MSLIKYTIDLKPVNDNYNSSYISIISDVEQFCIAKIGRIHSYTTLRMKNVTTAIVILNANLSVEVPFCHWWICPLASCASTPGSHPFCLQIVIQKLVIITWQD